MPMWTMRRGVGVNDKIALTVGCAYKDIIQEITHSFHTMLDGEETKTFKLKL
jgi:hypothetical protein